MLVDHFGEPGVIFGSKAVGEPPLMLAFSVREAIRAAIAAFSPDPHTVVELDSPATPERIFFAIQRAKQPIALEFATLPATRGTARP